MPRQTMSQTKTQRVETVKKSFRIRNQSKRRRKTANTTAVYRLDSVDISTLPTRYNPYEVAANLDIQFWGDAEQRQNYVLGCHKQLLKMYPHWQHIEWSPDTTEYDVILVINQLMETYAQRHNLATSLDHGYDKHYNSFYRHSFYHEWSRGRIYVPSAKFLMELEVIDPTLYKIIAAVIGKTTAHINMMTWMEAYEVAYDYLVDMIDSGEIEDQDSVKADLRFWNEGPPAQLHKAMRTLAKTSMRQIETWVKAYNWNTYFKKRVLVWLRLSKAVLKQKSTLDTYKIADMPGHDDILFPGDYCVFKWADDSETQVCNEFFQYMDERIGNAESCALMSCVDYNNPGRKEPNAILLDTWMAYSHDLFNNAFCKYLIKTKSKRLLTIL